MAVSALATAAVAGAASSYDQGRQARRSAQRKTRNAAAEQAKAEADAQQRAYAEMSWARRAQRENSLFTGGGMGGGSSTLGV